MGILQLCMIQRKYIRMQYHLFKAETVTRTYGDYVSPTSHGYVIHITEYKNGAHYVKAFQIFLDD